MKNNKVKEVAENIMAVIEVAKKVGESIMGIIEFIEEYGKKGDEKQKDVELNQEGS